MVRFGPSLCLALLLLGVAPLPAAEDPSLDLFAGWSWWPYPYGRYPYAWGPSVGVGYPFGFDRFHAPYLVDGYPYGYAPYWWGPYWEWSYGVRYRVWPDREPLDVPEGDVPFLPGTAPTDLRSAERKTEWDHAIEAFLNSPAPTPSNAATNAPVSREKDAAQPSAKTHSPNT